MQWELSEEQSAYQDTLRRWLEDHDARRSADPVPFLKQFADEGWPGVGTPEALGGQGGGLVELALTAEELGRAAAPSGLWLGTVLAVLALPADLATQALSGEVPTVLAVTADAIPALAPGREASPASGLPEAGAGAPHAAGRPVPLVIGADQARRLVVPTADGVYLVDEFTARPRILLDHSRGAADVEFTGGRVLDVDPEAFVQAAALRAAVLVAADALGASHRLLDMAVEYSLQRHQFGVPIGSFQAVKHAAATMLVAVEAARSIVYLAAASVEVGDAAAPLQAAAAKAQVTAGAVESAESALTLHGAIGYTWEHDLHLFSKRCALDQRLFGSPPAWNEQLADRLELLA